MLILLPMSASPQTILVTGANKGIGLETCRQLARLGHHVILSARSGTKGEAAVETLASEGLKVEFLLLDTADELSIQRAARELKLRIKALNVLINNAAILDIWQGSILDAKADGLRDTFMTNVIGPILLTQALLPFLEAGKPSRVINVSSELGSVANIRVTAGPGTAAAAAAAPAGLPVGRRRRTTLPAAVV